MRDGDRYYNELTFNGLKIIIQESNCSNGIIVDYWAVHSDTHLGTETFWYADTRGDE